MIADKPRRRVRAAAAREGQDGSHHPVGDGRRRSGRPLEDGLPRPAQPDDPRQGGRADRADDAASGSIRYKFPLDDKETFALLCRGETKGIFQLESGGIRDLLQRMKPDHFRDIIATNALYRPGPLEGGMVDDYIEVKHGRKQAEYPHPVMKDVLDETHGVMVYQEQVMRILNVLGGIELADAYTCIKAISKKKLPIDRQVPRSSSSHGAERQGPRREARPSELFGMIEKFAGYGFNKSHSTAYALIAYRRPT